MKSVANRKIWILVLIACASSLPMNLRAAGSIFSGLGSYGVFESFSSSRAVGMGNAGLALNDSVSLNALNPAALAAIKQTRISASGYLTRQWMRDHQASDLEDWGQVECFCIALRLREGLAIGFFLTPESRIDYLYNWDVVIDDQIFTQSNQGSGGLSRIALNLGWAPWSWAKIGAGVTTIWGYNEEKRISYIGQSGYNQYIEFLNEEKWLAFGGSLGILLQPAERLTLGAVFEPEIPIDLDRTYSYTDEDSSITYKTEYKLAARYGLGLAYQFKPQWQAAGQVVYRPWSELEESLPPGPQEYQDSYELAAGFEWIPGHWNDDFLLRRMQYRFGFRWETGYALSEGSSIDGYYATLGLGYPFNEGKDRFDFSLEYGLRGDLSANGGQENILKFRVGLNIGETWFVRTKPPWE